MPGILFWRGLVEAVDVYQLVPVVRLKNSRVGQSTKVLGVKKKDKQVCRDPRPGYQGNQIDPH